MGVMAPPYLNKNVEKLEKELVRAENKERRAREKYETAKEYTKLCKTAVENAKK